MKGDMCENMARCNGHRVQRRNCELVKKLTAVNYSNNMCGTGQASGVHQSQHEGESATWLFTSCMMMYDDRMMDAADDLILPDFIKV